MFENIDRLRLDTALTETGSIRAEHLNYFSERAMRGRQKDPNDVSMSREILPYWLDKSEQNPSRVDYEGNLVYDNKSNDGSLGPLEDPLLSNVKSIESSLKSGDSDSLSNGINKLHDNLEHLSQSASQSFYNKQLTYLNSISRKLDLYAESSKEYQAK